MQKQVINCINQGMNRDVGISQLSEKEANYAFENHNIRITAINDNTLYTITNEKGTKKEDITLLGTFLGSCVLNNFIVIFTHHTRKISAGDTGIEVVEDYIYRIENLNGTLNSIILYKGDLGFNLNHPIEAIGYYESEEVQKVYWVDGLNPNRFINIADTTTRNTNKYQFDFQGHINSIPEINITKNYNKAGTFQAGIIQYFATYYNKYGTETCIVWQSDLQYISMSDRGAKPDETVSCAFDFTLSNLDTSYDYIRIYAAYRAGLNGTAEGRIVTELEIVNSDLSFSDYGTNYQNYNAEDIHYLGGQNIIASTLDYKQDTLFLGNITLNTQEDNIDDIRALFRNACVTREYEGIQILECPYIKWEYKKIEDVKDESFVYTQQINKSQEQIAGFKYRELYRFGIQFMNSTGDWTPAIWIGDKYCDLCPKQNLEEGVLIAQATIQLPVNIQISKYSAYRLLVAETSIESRRIITQGVINPTLFNYKDRENNRPFSINSWIFRPRKGNVANRHYDMLATQDSEYAEIQGIMTRKIPGKLSTDVKMSSTDSNYRDGFMLVFAPNYLAGCRLWYKLIYYNTNSCNAFRQSDYSTILNIKEGQTLDTNTLTGREAALAISKSNQCLKDGTTIDKIIPYHFSQYDIISDRLIKATTWEDIASKTISAISEDLKKAGKDVVISENMLPSAEQYKQAWKVKGDKSGKVWTYIGLGVALAASIVATIFSFGAASPALGAVVGTTVTLAATMKALGLAAAAAASVVAAIGSASGIATIAEQYKYNEDLEDIDRQLAIKGIYPILTDHTLNSRKEGADTANTLLAKTFDNWTNKDKNPFTLKATNNSLGSDANFYAMGGRLTIVDEKEEEKNSKRDSFYVDESIVSLNAPDIDDISEFIKNSNAYDLNLIGTIPINQVTTDYLIYAEQGLASTSQTITGLQYTKNFSIKEGLFSDFLYQDSKWPDNFSTDDDDKQYIQATAAVSAYKTFMWNRNTSLSLWVPGFEIKDVFGNTLTSPPAKPIKKIFANYKYSNNTNYYTDIFNIGIENILVHSSDQNQINVINYNGDNKYYMGNVDSIILPYDDYTLIADDQNNEFHKNEEGIVDTQLKDIIPLRYKTSPHIIIPFKWDINGPTLLPLTSGEQEVTLDGLYGDTSEHDIYGIPPKKLQGSYTMSGDPVIIKYYLLQYPEYTSLSSTPTLEEKISILPKVIGWYEEAKNLYTEQNKGDDWGIDSDVANKLFNNTTPVLLYYQGKGKVYLNGKLEDVDIQYGAVYGEVRISDRDNIIIEGNVDIADVINYGIRFSDPEVEAGQTVVYIWPDGTEHSTPYTEPRKYIQKNLPSMWNETSPYLFLGELVKTDFDYNNWYGGNTDYALQQINWNVCSHITPIRSKITNTWGDTYYQRWDCLKTYPFSEQEVNSNVEVLSFMVESHINLDGRSDINRGTHNLLNLRPSNTNLFNPVYNQQDNFFSYKVLDEKFDKNIFENQVVWSLSKTNLDNIDKWTDIHALNTLQLDGKLGSINKIINMNDVLLAFQDTGISTIDYNLKSALTTYEGVPLQMGNTGKVTGYTKITSDVGCHNKWAMCLTEAGLFFIDSYKKALYAIASNASPADISSTKYFSVWFKENINNDVWNPNTNIQAFRLNYDSNTKDLYISNDSTCLLYNTKLQVFTSFMDYINTPLILNSKGKSIAFYQSKDLANINNITLWSLFEGKYNSIYGESKPYSIEYRLNPSPYTDNMFTNYQYVADWTDGTTTSYESHQFNTDRFDHFDIVEAWNEYQYGILSADTNIGVSPTKTKFRIWRGDIPRNDDQIEQRVLKGDRMRNPWIHLKFTKNKNKNTKMTFHNLNVIYYK